MRYLFLFLIGLLLDHPAYSQGELADQLRKRYDTGKGFEAEVRITVDIPGITVPVKLVRVSYEKGKTPRVKGAGLILLPKSGWVDQFSDLLGQNEHWILTGTDGDLQTWKLVSLDPSAAWVTADVTVNLKETRIEKVNLVTKESGVFQISHFYGNRRYPDRTEISFVTDKLAIPLKFLGKSGEVEVMEPNGKVKGKIILEFFKVKI